MKKVLSLLLVLSLVLGAVAPAMAAPSDVEGTEYEEAVERLSALDVLDGYPDGTFRPNNTITRAEMAAALVKLAGNEYAVEFSRGETSFSDVSASYWAAPYINVGQKMGYIDGHTDGTFRPTEPVTYEQAIKLVVELLGYGEKAMKNGGYPLGHIMIASDLDVTADVDGVKGLPAPRGIVAQLMDNSLTVGLADYEDGVWEEGEKTLLDKIGVDSLEATVVSYDEEDMELVAEVDGDEEEYSVMEGLDFSNLTDAVVKIWVKDDVIADYSIESEFLFDFVSDIDTDEEEIELTNLGKDYDYAEDLDVDDVDEDDFVKAVLNSDDEIVSVEDYELTEGGLITSVEDDMIEYTEGEGSDKLRNLDDADSMMVVVEGELATYAELEEGMYFDYYENSDDYVIVANDATVSGEFTKIDEDDSEITIDGDSYVVAEDTYVSTDDGDSYTEISDLTTDLDDLFEEDVTAYLNNVGDVAYITSMVEDPTTSFYGFVEDIDTFEEDVRVVKAVEDEIDAVVYETDINSDSDNELDETQLNEVTYGDKVADETVYEFVVNEDNEIVEINDVDVDTYTADSFNEDYDYIKADLSGSAKRVYVEDAVFFDLTGDEIELISWEDIEGTTVGSNVVEFEADSSVASVVSFTSDANSVLGEEAADIFTGFVNNRTKIASDLYLYEIETPEGTVEVEAEEKVSEETVVFYEEIVDDATTIVASEEYDSIDNLITEAEDNDADVAVYETVYNKTVNDIDSDFITIGSEEYKLQNDIVVYEVTDAGTTDEDLELVDANDIEENDTVYFVADSGTVKVMFFIDNDAPVSGGNSDVDGDATVTSDYTRQTGEHFIFLTVDGESEAYTVTVNTVIEDADGNTVTSISADTEVDYLMTTDTNKLAKITVLD